MITKNYAPMDPVKESLISPSVEGKIRRMGGFNNLCKAEKIKWEHQQT